MSVQIIPVTYIYQGANYRVEKSFSIDSTGAMCPHKGRFATLKVLYGVSSNLNSLVFIYLLHFQGCGGRLEWYFMLFFWDNTQQHFKKYSRLKTDVN